MHLLATTLVIIALQDLALSLFPQCWMTSWLSLIRRAALEIHLRLFQPRSLLVPLWKCCGTVLGTDVWLSFRFVSSGFKVDCMVVH